MKNTEEVFRAYSMANHPAEGNMVMLNIRIATPPPHLWNEVPPGIASSYVRTSFPYSGRLLSVNIISLLGAIDCNLAERFTGLPKAV